MRKLHIITGILLALLVCCGRAPHQSSMLEHPETTYYFGSGDFWESEEDSMYDSQDETFVHRLTIAEMAIAINSKGNSDALNHGKGH